MPGLVVDRYGGCLVMTIGTAGVEKWRETIIELLRELLAPVGIYERSEGRSRQLEGLSDRIGPAAGEVPERVEIRENGLCFEVDLLADRPVAFRMNLVTVEVTYPVQGKDYTLRLSTLVNPNQ